jgi:sugar phosphate isomerase/epimerase
MAEVRLGINTGFALKRWPEPEAWAEIVVGLGLRDVQLSFDLLDPGWPPPVLADLCDRTVRAAAAHRLAIHSTFTGLAGYAHNLLGHPEPGVRAHAQAWFESGVRITARLGAGWTGGHMGAFSAADQADPARQAGARRDLVGRVRALAGAAAAQGLRGLLWEAMPVPREIPHTPAEAVLLLEEVNHGAAVPVRLCLDLGHCCAADLDQPGDPHAWLEQLLPWVAVVHLQQTDGRGDRHWPFSRAFDGQGIVDVGRILRVAQRSPMASIYLFLEVCHPHEASDRQVLSDLAESAATWAAALTACSPSP